MLERYWNITQDFRRVSAALILHTQGNEFKSCGGFIELIETRDPLIEWETIDLEPNWIPFGLKNKFEKCNYNINLI